MRVSYRGIEPRQPLRIDVDKGHAEVVTLRLWTFTSSTESAEKRNFGGDAPTDLVAAETGGVDMSAITGELSAPDGEREVELRVRLKVKEADAEELLIAWKIVDATLIPHGEDRSWERAVKGVEGMRGTSRIARTGQPLESTVTGGGGPDPTAVELRTTIRRFMAEPGPVYPVEPVGHSAVWEVSRRVVDSGVQTQQTQRFEVKNIKKSGRVELSERDGAKLLSDAIDMGQGLNAFDPTVDQFSMSGDASWKHEPGAIMLIGDAGGVATARIGLALGYGQMGLKTTVETEIFVSRAP